MRWLLALCLVVPALTHAQEAAPSAPVPSVLKRAAAANKATGPSLASGKDEDFDEPPPAPSGDALLPGDTALLRATLWAFEPAPREIRVQAVEDLGLLGDDRLLNALAHLVVDPDQWVQLAAVRAVRAIRSPRSEEILTNVVKHPNMPPAVKQAALEGLLFQNTRSALVFIWSVGNNPNWGSALYGTARRLLQEVPKDAWGAAPTQEQPT